MEKVGIFAHIFHFAVAGSALSWGNVDFNWSQEMNQYTSPTQWEKKSEEERRNQTNLR